MSESKKVNEGAAQAAPENVTTEGKPLVKEKENIIKKAGKAFLKNWKTIAGAVIAAGVGLIGGMAIERHRQKEDDILYEDVDNEYVDNDDIIVND